MNTLNERLEIYELALNDFESGRHNTYYGFCYYFYNEGLLYCSGDFKRTLPELYEQKPIECCGLDWFPQGAIKPRIECLKKAIELTNLKIQES